MKLINNKVEEYIQEPGIDGIYKSIRDAAAICYQTDTSKSKLTPKEFVENVILAKAHGRALEFGTVYLAIPSRDYITISHYRGVAGKYNEVEFTNPYSRVVMTRGSHNYVTTNMRVIMQGDYKNEYDAWKNNYDKNWLDDLKYMCEPTKHHYKRRTFKMILSRGASDDLRTHVTLSSMCESTRFCNYSKGKYGCELTGIKPYWIDFKTDSDIIVKTYKDGSVDNEQVRGLDKNNYDFVMSMALEEMEYMRQSENGLQPQQLKRLFPLWGKCELRLCGFEDSWDNFMWRRLDEHADPECTHIAELIQKNR